MGLAQCLLCLKALSNFPLQFDLPGDRALAGAVHGRVCARKRERATRLLPGTALPAAPTQRRLEIANDADLRIRAPKNFLKDGPDESRTIEKLHLKCRICRPVWLQQKPEDDV